MRPPTLSLSCVLGYLKLVFTHLKCVNTHLEFVRTQSELAHHLGNLEVPCIQQLCRPAERAELLYLANQRNRSLK